MKIHCNEVKEIPSNYGKGFCVFGELDEKISDWVAYHGFAKEPSGKFTNIHVPEEYDVQNCFFAQTPYRYVDGFSPNLNKHLHLGHVSNFVLAKSLQYLGIGEYFIANLGDTLKGDVSNDDGFKAYISLCKEFDYQIHKIYKASELNQSKLKLDDGDGDYLGTKVVYADGRPIVCIRSDGSTTYFYQDIVLAETLDAPTLYITGAEQADHFSALKNLYPYVHHLPTGLVTVNNKKMSSREGSTITYQEVVEQLQSIFGEGKQLVWNVLTGYILKSSPSSTKNIDMEQLKNVRLSPGLYLSYTLSRLKSAGLDILKKEEFNSFMLQYKLLKSQVNLDPQVLLRGLMQTAKQLNDWYLQFNISNNKKNHKLFLPLAEDLLLGMNRLGMYNVDRV